MSNDQATPTPADEPHLVALIEMVNRLVGLMSDPKAVQARLSQLSAAHSDAKAASAQAAADREAADKRVAAAEAEVEAARERHGLERDKHHAAMAARETDIVELERKAAEHLKAAEADRAEAQKIKDVLTKKLAALTSAA
jgi:hypothetical protein